jgi:hypothetical protein
VAEGKTKTLSDFWWWNEVRAESKAVLQLKKNRKTQIDLLVCEISLFTIYLFVISG